eukprot:TRINITY_DN869_c0_g3_i1.p1 TRINITY_DN869_c0_g3~~TRINITY_DN869_c0_g3_i1.p1  ORF type:complete len:150 (-),score=26.46 TRINITY_DN869_c0_g3_i1:216-665(-)
MNLDYTNINIKEYSPAVREKYAFPADNTLLKRFGSNELPYTREENVEAAAFATREGFLCLASLVIGLTSYTYLMLPTGKVIRDRLDASMPLWRRVTRRVLPFVGIAYPVYLLRQTQYFFPKRRSEISPQEAGELSWRCIQKCFLYVRDH